MSALSASPWRLTSLTRRSQTPSTSCWKRSVSVVARRVRTASPTRTLDAAARRPNVSARRRARRTVKSSKRAGCDREAIQTAPAQATGSQPKRENAPQGRFIRRNAALAVPCKPDHGALVGRGSNVEERASDRDAVWNGLRGHDRLGTGGEEALLRRVQEARARSLEDDEARGAHAPRRPHDRRPLHS